MVKFGEKSKIESLYDFINKITISNGGDRISIIKYSLFLTDEFSSNESDFEEEDNKNKDDQNATARDN